MTDQIKPDKSVRKVATGRPGIGGLAGWLLSRLGARSRQQPGLVVRERITLAPRQTLSLVEADGRRLLIATSPEGTPAFYALDEPARNERLSKQTNRTKRVSW
jgi:flagellar biogenesis protein FliO